MSFLPSQNSHTLVQRLIDDIKKRAEEHAKRYARPKIRGSYAQSMIPPRVAALPSRSPHSLWKARNEQHSSKNGMLQGDYFTRLVDSSPKPRVLRSAHHPAAIHLLKLTHSASYRKYRKLVLLTSAKLIREYCARHGSCSRIYTTSHENPLLLEKGVRADKVLICSQKLLQKVSDLHSYERGIVAEVSYPQPSQHLGNASLVVCVAPGGRSEESATLASIMRTAQALQWQAIWLLKHGAHDFLDPLSIRASQNCLDTTPYVSGDTQEAIAFANENRLLICICSEGGDTFESDHLQQSFKQHHGVMLLVGKQPKELVNVATKINISTASKRWHKFSDTVDDTEATHYKLDSFTKSCILLYLVRKYMHSSAPRSPYIV